MAALLSPVQLQAAAALLQNQGLTNSPELQDQLDQYNALPTISLIRDTIANGSSVLANTTVATLQTLASNSCPALADSIPQAFVSPFPPTTSVNTPFAVTSPTSTNSGLSGMIELVVDRYLGNGDLSKFAQTLSAAQGYCVTTNVFINSAINAQTYLADTFTGMDNLITGDLTQVNLDTKNFGQDLYNLGEAISLVNLDNFGSPLALIQQIAKRAGITTPVIVALSQAGVNENIILNLGDPNIVVSDSVQKTMYSALSTITGNDLTQILNVLGVTTTGINSLADLLNPVKLFPNSYSTLTTPVCDGCEPTSNVVMDIGTVMFQTRTPPAGGNAVYPISDTNWSPFMNNNAVWEFTGSVFETRQQTNVTAQSWPAWSQFMNTNAVWESDIYALSFVRSYSVTFPTSGNYTFTSQCDNYATVSLNGNQVLYVNGFTGAPQINEIYVTSGTYTLEINATNAGSYGGGNPAGFALNIASATSPADFVRSYTIDIPVTGLYKLTAQCTGEGDIIIDGDSTSVLYINGSTPVPDTAEVTLTQGSHEILIDINSSEVPAGVGLTIVSAFSTRPTPQCGLRGIYIPDVTAYSSDVSVSKLTEIEYNYRKLFGRPSDSQGYQYWVSSGLTGQSLISAMVSSATATDLQYYRSRLRLGSFPVFQGSIGSTPTGSVTGTVNTKLESLLPESNQGISYARLSKIIPSDQALADRALVTSLQQITNINKITLRQLADAYLNVETNKDLPAINAQFQPVPQDAIDYFINGLAIGSGDNGTILIVDVLGSAAGTVVLPEMTTVVETMTDLSSSLTTLNGIYTIMLDIVDGAYGDPTTGPIIGLPPPYNAGEPYANADVVLTTVMIPAAQSEIVNIQAGSISDTAKLNSAFTAIGTQLAKEANFQKLASINVNEMTGNSQASTQTLVFALPSYGLQTEEGGLAQFIEALADKDSAGGQSIVATLREGRNKTVLNESGITSASNISSDPATPPPQATLIPSEYNQTEALSRIIT